MIMNPHESDIILGREPADVEQIESLAARYPSLIVPVAAALRDNPGLEASIPSELKARLAICVGDDVALAAIVGDEPELLSDFYGENTVTTPDTVSAIDTFIDTYGGGNAERETDALTKMIFNPQPDYAAILQKEEAGSGDEPASSNDDSTSRGIESFLSTHPAAGPAPARSEKIPFDAPAQQPPGAELEADEDAHKGGGQHAETKRVVTMREGASLSESLARAMIKKGNYRKALEIITELSLKNPEKITYFADQIRFLKKLIINDNNS